MPVRKIDWYLLSQEVGYGTIKRYALARKNAVEPLSLNDLHLNYTLFKSADILSRTFGTRSEARAAKKKHHYILDLKLGAIIR